MGAGPAGEQAKDAGPRRQVEDDVAGTNGLAERGVERIEAWDVGEIFAMLIEDQRHSVLQTAFLLIRRFQQRTALVGQLGDVAVLRERRLGVFLATRRLIVLPFLCLI